MNRPPTEPLAQYRKDTGTRNSGHRRENHGRGGLLMKGRRYRVARATGTSGRLDCIVFLLKGLNWTALKSESQDWTVSKEPFIDIK